MLALSFITQALWRAWQTEHVLWGLHQPLACCLMQFSQMYQSGRRDPAIWTAFIASWANSQEMFNNVPCTSVARSRFLEWRVAKRNPGSALFQLLVTCWFCCYCLRAYFFKGCLSLRFPKTRFKVTWIRPSGSRSSGQMCTPESLARSRTAWIRALGRLACCIVFPADRAVQSWLLQQPQTLCSWCKRDPCCLGNRRPNAATDRELSGHAGYISRLQNGIQPGMLTASVTEFKRGSAEYNSSIPSCLILK